MKAQLFLPGETGLYIKFHSVVDILKDFENQTEKKFFNYGFLLNENHIYLRKILSVTQEIISIISSSQISDSIEDLKKLVEELRTSLTSTGIEIGNTHLALTAINEQIILINTHLDNFDGFVKKLRMLGLSTKIESARIREIDSGFENLAENVESLSNSVEKKEKLIRRKSDSLFKLIEMVDKSTQNFNNDNREIAEDVFNKIDDNINLLTNKFKLAQENSEIISDSSNQISNTISRIVTSLQYQDISKQQSEHICSALIDLTDAAKMLDKGFDNSTEDAKNIRLMYDICQIQISQINNTKTEFLSAGRNLSNELQSVSGMTDKLRVMINQLINTNENNNSSFINSTADDLKQIMEILSHNSEDQAELSEMIEKVNITVSDLSHFVNEIEEIGNEIELIALNSQVKSAHLGNEGAALGIVAENIKKLSLNAKDQTINLSNSFTAIDNEAEHLNKKIISNDNSPDSNSVNTHEINVNNILDMINKIQEDLSERFQVINDLTQQLGNNIFEEKGHEEFLRLVENSFDETTEILNDIVRKIQPFVIAETAWSKEKLKDLKAKYTMHSERIAHTGNKETLNNSTSSYKFVNNTNDNDQFDDNIELF